MSTNTRDRCPSSPALTAAIHSSLQFWNILCQYYKDPGAEGYRITPDTEAVPLLDLARQVSRAT